MPKNKKILLLLALVVIAITASGSLLFKNQVTSNEQTTKANKHHKKISKQSIPKEEVVVKETVQHLQTPKQLRGIYITSWVGSQVPWRTKLVKSALESGINAVVIDVKDCTGYISFDSKNENIKALGTEEIRIQDLKEWIQELHAQKL